MWDAEVMGGYYDDQSDAPTWHRDDDGQPVAIFEQSVGERLAEKYDHIEIVADDATELDAEQADSDESESDDSADEQDDATDDSGGVTDET